MVKHRDAPSTTPRIEVFEGSGTKMIVQAMVISGLVQGMSVPKAAEAAGVTAGTVHSWKRDDLEFQQALLEAEEAVVHAIIDDAVSRAKSRVKELFPEAVEVFARELHSSDARIRLQAANAIARLGLPRQTEVKVGFEGLLRGVTDVPALPTAGD